MQTIWDLSELYTSPADATIEADFATCDQLITKLETYRGRVASLSSGELKELIIKQETIQILLYKLGEYASLLETTNTGVDAITRFTKSIDERTTVFAKRILFLGTELKDIDDSTWKKHLRSPDLKTYRHLIEIWQREAKHTLSEPEEKILADKSLTSWQALNHLFDITTDTLTIEWEGKEITLSEALNFLHNHQPDTRKKIALAIHKILKTNSKTTPAIYNTLIQDKKLGDATRGYAYPEQSRFNSDDVDKPTVEALIAAVNQNSTVVNKYYTLKKRLLGVDTLYWWDRYAPLPQPQKQYSIKQAQQMVLEAFTEFSPKLGQIVQRMYDEHHIDWLPSATKRGGAFCAFGVPVHLPYVLMNFTGSINDVLTLAHELGHAVHDVLAKENNPFSLAHPSLATAEIASTFGEELLVEKLITAPDISNQDKTALLMDRIEGNIATIHRQISMFQFEQAAHTERAKAGELSKEDLDNLWHNAIKKPYGDSLKWTDEHKNFWMYIPHIFHTPFYVYSYAFAQLCTLALVETYKETKDKPAFVTTYIDLLKAGGSMTPNDNLARANLDISRPEFWTKGIKAIESDIEELKRLIN